MGTALIAAVLSRAGLHLSRTTVPTLAGFWISWLPWSLPQRWPLCCWVAVGVDHFPRRIMGVRAFRGRPTAKAMSAFLAAMIRAPGQAPRHLITDRGREFTVRSLRRGCRRAGIRQRFGAIGKHGRIALVERCIRTLKDEGVQRWLAPIRWRSVGCELSPFADWFNGQRPHAGLAGATPDEIYFGRPQAPVRGRPGQRLALEVWYLEGRAHLPVVLLTRAA